MKQHAGVSALVLAALAAIPSAASAQQVLTAVQSQRVSDGAADSRVSTVAGQQVSTSYGGGDTRAVSNFGVNKIYASGNAQYEQNATSAWVDSFTVGGAAGSTVHVSFNFAIDGNALSTGNGFNYQVYALRGGNVALSGYNSGTATGFGTSFNNGTGYDRVVATAVLPSSQALPQGRVSEFELRDFNGFYNFNNNGGQAGSFTSGVLYVQQTSDPNGSYYRVELPYLNPQVGGEGFETRYYATGFRNFRYGQPITPFFPYSANAATQQQGQIRAQLVAGYGLLSYGELCYERCENGTYPGSNLSLSFDLAAGSVFSIASLLYADDLRTGTIDFFNTAKVTGVTATQLGSPTNVSLTSTSGTLQAQAGGGFGYPAATAGAVPEPASWALMIAGFGLVGVMARQRRRTVALA